MKKKIVLFTLLGIHLISYAQKQKTEIKSAIIHYFQALSRNDYETVLDCLYPKLFELSDRKALLAQMKKSQNDSTFGVTYTHLKVKKVSKPLKVQAAKYALVSYKFDMEMIIKPQEGLAADNLYNIVQDVYSTFQGLYGKKNVTFNPEKTGVIIKIDTKMYAIQQPDIKGWKFLEKKKNRSAILAKLLPKEVLDKWK